MPGEGYNTARERRCVARRKLRQQYRASVVALQNAIKDAKNKAWDDLLTL